MKYKAIKSVAHNLGHSFVSFMNYRADDYIMSYLVRAALVTGESVLRIDLITGHASPQALLTSPIGDSVSAYVEWLPKLLTSQNVHRDAIVAAGMTLRLDLSRASDDRGFENHVEVPFECVVALKDDRGREHVGRTTGWWSAHRGGPPPLISTFYARRDAGRVAASRPHRRPWWKFWARVVRRVVSTDEHRRASRWQSSLVALGNGTSGPGTRCPPANAV